MKNEPNKEDQLVIRIMKDYQMDNPPPGFTDRVMQSIKEKSSKSAIDTPPLISRRGWIGIASCLGLLILVIFLGSESQVPEEAGWMARMFSSFNLPVIDLSSVDIFGWLNHGSPTLLWIFMGIGGLLISAILNRMIFNLKIRHFYTL